MMNLEPPDSHFLDAATGWFELGNLAEAWHEFSQIRPELRLHPAVLDFHWSYLARQQRWEEALTVAEQLVAVAPAEPNAWIHRSFALHELRRTAEALELLTPAWHRFPREETIPYNLACYTCQLGDLPAAREWLARVLKLNRLTAAKVVRLKSALEDPDLQPLWPELRERLLSLETTRLS